MLAMPLPARAAAILFVADSDGDSEIVTALRDDGHTVTVVMDDYRSSTSALRGSLSSYDAVFWSADGTGHGSTHTDAVMFANLDTYVRDGGRVLVTGFDSIASPTDPLLINFLGGTGGRDATTAGSAIVSDSNSLTVGVVDIRGVVPTTSGDRDCLTGLGVDTTAVVTTPAASELCAQWTLRRLGGGEVAYISNDGSGSEWTTVATGPSGAYNAAIRNFASAAALMGSDPGGPHIEFDYPFSSDEGDEILVDAIVEDLEGDLFTFSWDLDDDGVFGETPDALSYTVPAGTTDGPGAVRIGVRAVDMGGRTSTVYATLPVANVPPRVVGEVPEYASIEVDLAYAMEVEDPGADDPLTFEVTEGPEGMTVSEEGVVSWVPTERDITMPDELVHVAIRIRDDDGGDTDHEFDLVVSPNRQPSPPLPAFPVDGIGIISRSPLLSIQNSEDFDLDALSYQFEIDTVDSFDSADRIRSDLVDEMPGYTSYQVAETLAEGTRYFWRVRAFDGMIYSQWRSTRFFVIRDPALGPPDAGVPDGGRFAYDGRIPGPDRVVDPPPGGCAVGGPDVAPLAPLSIFAALAALLRRRRR